VKSAIYLDSNATTVVRNEVVQEMLPYFTEKFYNPSAVYEEANIAKRAVDGSRVLIAELLGAKHSDEIIFTGSATESNNLAIQGALAVNKSRRHIITTQIEHPSVYDQCRALERQGYEVTYLQVTPEGKLDIKDLIAAIRPDTAVVSIMYANNETGVVFPIETLSRVVKLTDEQILFHTDATQAVGKLEINLSRHLNYVDMLSFSGHKLHAPKGIGALYWRKKADRQGIIYGGHQEKGLRAGTENVPYIVALSKALQMATLEMSDYRSVVGALRDDLEAFIETHIPSVIINCKNVFRLDNTLSASFKGIEGESIVYALNAEGICVSTGSACSSGALTLSRVIRALNVPEEFAHGTIRISLCLNNTKVEMDRVKKFLPKVVENLRKISPFWS